MIKKMLLVAVLVMLMAGLSFAQEPEKVKEPDKASLNFKQGLVYNWKNSHTESLTSFEIARTRPIESFGKWNMLWDGWTADGGLESNDAINAIAEGRLKEIDSFSILLGRKVGTLGDYIPIDFPLKDKFTITVYPIGLYFDTIWDKPDVSLASGGAFLKISIKI